MTATSFPIDELRELADAACDGTLTERDVLRLETLLRGSPGAQRFYLAQVRLDGCLRWEFGNQAQDQTLPSDIVPCSDLPCVGAAVEPAHQLDLDSQTSPPLIAPPSTSFVGGWTFSYLTATVILGMMLLGAWAYKISYYQQFDPSASSQRYAPTTPEILFVGRITSMKDCRWADPDTEAYAGASVPLGRKYALSSGLMEITYHSGARVILEGPCAYEVESRAGGYLSLGKLTARIGEGRAKREERAKPQAANPQSLIPNPLFAIRTPTAVITDLGTEFGVEVSENGNTFSRVFRGSVKVQVVGDGPRPEVVLRVNESARVEKDDTAASIVVLRFKEGDGPPQFTRRMVEPPKLHDYAIMVLADGPLFYWTFDESAGAAIEQIRRLPYQSLYPLGGAGRCDHAAIGSGLALGQAADFSGSAGVFASKMLQQGRSMPSAWAIEFWVQATGEREQGTGQYVLNAGIGARPPYFQNNPAVIFNWPHDAEKNELQLFYNRGGPTHDGPILADEGWRHVILVFYGNGDFFGVAPRVDAVIDGRPRTIDRGKFSAGFSLNGRLCLGAAKLDLSHAFRGRIDELAFYDLSKMTVTQIEARIADLGRRHFAAARSDSTGVPSNIAPSHLGEEPDKRESTNRPENGKEH